MDGLNVVWASNSTFGIANSTSISADSSASAVTNMLAESAPIATDAGIGSSLMCRPSELPYLVGIVECGTDLTEIAQIREGRCSGDVDDSP